MVGPYDSPTQPNFYLPQSIIPRTCGILLVQCVVMVPLLFNVEVG